MLSPQGERFAENSGNRGAGGIVDADNKRQETFRGMTNFKPSTLGDFTRECSERLSKP